MVRTRNKAKPGRMPWGIWLTVSAAMAIATVCAVIIWRGFSGTPETNSVILVAGNKTLAGSTVEVKPKAAVDPGHMHLSATLEERNQYSVRFFLTSGTYTVRVLAPDGSSVAEVTEFIPPGERWTFSVPSQGGGLTPAPTTQPGSLR